MLQQLPKRGKHESGVAAEAGNPKNEIHHFFFHCCFFVVGYWMS